MQYFLVYQKNKYLKMIFPIFYMQMIITFCLHALVLTIVFIYLLSHMAKLNTFSLYSIIFQTELVKKQYG